MFTRFAFIPNADWKCEGKSIYIEHTHSDIIYIVLSILRTPEVVSNIWEGAGSWVICKYYIIL